MGDFFENALLWFLGLIVVVIIYCVVATVYDRAINYNNLVHVETNVIGCDKYRLKGDEWWVCPKGSNISQITEYVRSGKATVKVEVPVIEESK